MALRRLFQEDTGLLRPTDDRMIGGALSAIHNVVLNDLQNTVRVRYVRPGGSDDNDGTTPETAWATLVYACTQLLINVMNGCQVIDITGVTEVLPDGFSLPVIYCNTQSLVWAPGLFGSANALTIHADLVASLTVAPADITTITPNATTGQDKIETTLTLTPNALKGKVVSQFGFPVGVVKRNTATDIFTNASGLDAGADIVLSDPGAVLTTSGATDYNITMQINGNVSSLLIEGIWLRAPQAYGWSLSMYFSAGYINVGMCWIESMACLYSPAAMPFVFDSYIFPSSGGFGSLAMGGPFTMFYSHAEGLDLYTDWSTELGIEFLSASFDGCLALGSGSFGNAFHDTTQLYYTEFTNSPSNAISLLGVGTLNVQNSTFDSCGASPIKCDGFYRIVMDAVPAGSSNVGVGVELLNGANLSASASVALTGATNDVKVGNQAATTWAAVNAAPNHRVTDSGANGDSSSAKRL